MTWSSPRSAGLRRACFECFITFDCTDAGALAGVLFARSSELGFRYTTCASWKFSCRILDAMRCVWATVPVFLRVSVLYPSRSSIVTLSLRGLRAHHGSRSDSIASSSSFFTAALCSKALLRTLMAALVTQTVWLTLLELLPMCKSIHLCRQLEAYLWLGLLSAARMSSK